MSYGLVRNASPSGVAKAEVALTADTEIEVFKGNVPYDCTIFKITYNFANVVDAKAATGYLEVKSNVKQLPFRIPVGFGTGGAATAEMRFAGEIPVNIPCDKDEEITINMTMNEAGVSAFCGIHYRKGKSGQLTKADCNVAEDAAVSADTLTAFSTITIPSGKGGRIKKIIVSYANVVNAKGAGGYVTIDGTIMDGQHQYAVGGGSGGATDSSPMMGAQVIDVDIPVASNEIVTPQLYLAEAAVDAHIGILWV